MSRAAQLLEASFKVKKVHLPEKIISVPLEGGKPVKLKVLMVIEDWSQEYKGTEWEHESEHVNLAINMGSDDYKRENELEEKIDKEGVEIIHRKLVQYIVPVIKQHKEIQSIRFDKPWFYVMFGTQFYNSGGTNDKITDPIHAVAKEIAREVGGRYEGGDWKSPRITMPNSPYFKEEPYTGSKKISNYKSKKKGLVARFKDKYGKTKQYTQWGVNNDSNKS